MENIVACSLGETAGQELRTNNLSFPHRFAESAAEHLRASHHFAVALLCVCVGSRIQIDCIVAKVAYMHHLLSFARCTMPCMRLNFFLLSVCAPAWYAFVVCPKGASKYK